MGQQIETSMVGAHHEPFDAEAGAGPQGQGLRDRGTLISEQARSAGFRWLPSFPAHVVSVIQMPCRSMADHSTEYTIRYHRTNGFHWSGSTSPFTRFRLAHCHLRAALTSPLSGTRLHAICQWHIWERSMEEMVPLQRSITFPWQ